MKYIPSVNISQTTFREESYIITQNARSVVGSIINSFNIGIHSFNMIGSYGTGKSSFILALEHSLKTSGYLLTNDVHNFNGFNKFEFLKIVGDYSPLSKVLSESLPKKYISNNVFDSLLSFYDDVSTEGKFLVIVIDEFGKILEYAANHNPEKELYMLQKLAEMINDPSRNILLLTTLHQNFSSYSKGLSESQRNEWIKVRGRFGEIVFNEPVEQLLYMAATRIGGKKGPKLNKRFEKIFEIAQESKYISNTLEYEMAEKLYPMDIFAAKALTIAIQRYGQNERTLFSFLEAKGNDSLKEFKEHPRKTYNLADVYDYVNYNFYSYLSEINSDSSSWGSMRVALEKVEGLLAIDDVASASKIIKTIGMLNLFGAAGISFSKEQLEIYSKSALGVENVKELLDDLERYQIIRFAIYKSQYVLFDGTDVNIEYEVLEAGGKVSRSRDIIGKLNKHFNLPYEFANSIYYKIGTPRYFEYLISDIPDTTIPMGEIDGYIKLIFNSDDNSIDNIKQFSSTCADPILFAYFKRTSEIIDHIWEIDKLEYVLEFSIDDRDTVAKREVKSLLNYEKELLNNCVLKSLFSFNHDVEWIYKGNIITIDSKRVFNRMLSSICEDVYSETPIFINEMVNKHKPSGAMSQARVKLLDKLLYESNEPDLGFDDKTFPPEKTIYKTLLQTTGIHKSQFGTYFLQAPEDKSFNSLWNTCEDFLLSSSDKPKKIGELLKILTSRPFKLKQGFIDLWLPIYLIIKRDDYSLYDSKNIYIPVINKEVLDILQKSPNDFSVKAFKVEGVKIDIFNQYRRFVGASADEEFTTDSLIETIRPFMVFYNKLDRYAKNTKKLNRNTSLKFRDVLANAKDPEKTFFEDLPRALGLKESQLAENEEVLRRYVELMQFAIRDLRSCYIGLIERLESSIIDALGLESTDFELYRKELVIRYSPIKTHLLTNKQKAFYNRVMGEASDRKTWFESISYVILDKKLEDLLDEEEEYLVDNLIFSFKNLLKYVDISNSNIEDNNKFIRFEMISKAGGVQSQIAILSPNKQDRVIKLQEKIQSLFSGEDDVEVNALLNILKNKMNND